MADVPSQLAKNAFQGTSRSAVVHRLANRLTNKTWIAVT